MANVLDYLLGRPQVQPQGPVRYEDGLPSLTAYNPAPSEQFSQWLSGVLGARPGASLAKQNFATGVPELLPCDFPSSSMPNEGEILYESRKRTRSTLPSADPCDCD